MPAAEAAAILGERAMPVADLAESLRGLARIPGSEPVLVCGSMYLLAAFYALWPEALARSGGHCLSRTN